MASTKKNTPSKDGSEKKATRKSKKVEAPKTEAKKTEEEKGEERGNWRESMKNAFHDADELIKKEESIGAVIFVLTDSGEVTMIGRGRINSRSAFSMIGGTLEAIGKTPEEFITSVMMSSIAERLAKGGAMGDHPEWDKDAEKNGVH